MNIKEILSTLKSIFALDSNVVHKTENETINGVKSFNNDIVLNGNLNLRHSVDNGFIRVQGGSDENKGSRLILSGKDRPNREGDFELMATDGSVSSLLKGTKNGSLTWCNKNVDTIDSQGNGWIRYSNGIQICWGKFTNGSTYGWGKPFINTPIATVSHSTTNRTDVVATITTLNGNGVDAKLSTMDRSEVINQVLVIAFGLWK